MHLKDARLRLARAEEHLAELGRECVAFLEAKHHHSRQYHDAQRKCTVFEAWVDQQPPPRLGIIAGDALHSLRASLDYAIWRLYAAQGAKPNRDVKFPIYETEKEFLRSETRKRLHAVIPDVTAFVETAQPYHAGNRAAIHPLTVLHRLDIQDKHSRLNVAVAVAWLHRVSGTSVGQFAISDEFVDTKTVHYLESEAQEILVIQHRSADLKMEMKAEIAFEITFGDDSAAGGNGVARIVEWLFGEVSGIVRHLEALG
jgi:Tfp pilus assembly protein PilZ